MFRSSVDRWRHKIWIFAVKFFQNVRNRLQSLCQVLSMVIIEIVVNSTHIYEHMRVTISCWYALSQVGTMLLISSLTLVPSAHPQLTLKSVDFRSMHPKCVSVVGVFLWCQCAQGSNCSCFTPKMHFQWAD